jgi:type II secretory pathway component GspD/PulD (secretin)
LYVGGAATTTADVQTDSIFAGIVVGVVPFISDRGNVDLLIHPMQTEVDAASLQLLDVGGGNRVTLPKVSYKGMTTTLNIKDGDTVILGGLIDQNAASNNSGIPGLSDLPGVGRAFGAENSVNRSRELIMVLKVKLL